MPGTITTDLVTISSADTTTTGGTWADYGGSTLAIAVDADNKIQGAASVGMGTRSLLTEAGLSFVHTTTFPVTGGAHFFHWKNVGTAANMKTKAGSGSTLVLGSGGTTYPGTSWKRWLLDGSDTLPTGGWKSYTVDINQPAATTIGTLTASAMKFVGVGTQQQTAVGNTTRMFWADVIRYGTGLIVNQGTSAAPVAFTDIYTTDSASANAYGVMSKLSGIYYGAGKFYIGTATQNALTYFKDTNQVLVFQDFPVATDFYEIRLAGNSGASATTFVLGNFTNNLPSDGVTIKSAGLYYWTLNASAANTTCLLYACNFSGLRTAAFNSASVLKSCVVSQFGPIYPNGATVTDCTFQNVQTSTPISATTALVAQAPSAIAGVTNSKFISCANAITITASGSYDFVGLKFSGNTFDVLYTASGTATINLSSSDAATSNSTGGGTVVFVASNTFSITNIAVSSEVRVYDSATSTEICGVETIGFSTPSNCSVASDPDNAGRYKLTLTHSYSNTAVFIAVASLSYQFYRQNYTLKGETQSLLINQLTDRQYLNP